MKEQTVEFQARIYVYDLTNCAREFGFRADERWEIGMASSKEKAAIQQRYFPTQSTDVLPEMLAEMMRSVKFKLNQTLTGVETALDTEAIRKQHLQYLVAYSLNRLRR